MGRAGTIHNLPKRGILDITTFELLPNVPEALNILGSKGYFIAVVGSDKESIAGIDYPTLIWNIEQHIRSAIGYPIGFKLCTHHPTQKCGCRLPNIDLIDKFSKEENLAMSESIMIASREPEVKGALNAGIETIVRVRTGRTKWSKKSEEYPIYDTLLEAVCSL